MASLIDGLKSAPQIMGILNLTPDSFSDGGKFFLKGKTSLDIDHVLFEAEAMRYAGASILDLGGESTRPGALAVGVNEELDRVIPPLTAIASRIDCITSVDTSSPAVMIEAAKAGVGLINDVRGFRSEEAKMTIGELGLPVCVMHMQNEPLTMQDKPHYEDVVSEVFDWLICQTRKCVQYGVAEENILIDPGFGFGKNLQQNIDIFNSLEIFVKSGFPVLVGLSRKAMIGSILDKPVNERAFGSAVSAMLAVQKGVSIVRVHDVAETSDALKILNLFGRKN